MKLKVLTVLFFVLYTTKMIPQQQGTTAEEVNINRFIHGILLVPNDVENPNLVVLVQGSGPVDRNGNQPFMKNNSFKKLAEELAAQGVATFRFDKRILRMEYLGLKEKDIRFDDFITDVTSIIEYFKKKEKFRNLIVLGHSQGSLIGMIAAKDNADAFISIAGAAHPIDSVIVDQIAGQMPKLKENAQQSFQEMRKTGSTRNYDPMLEMIFRPSVQPFILSWMQYNPQEQIKKLNMPVLLINGNNDLQVEEDQAKKLQEAKTEAELVILEKMNHVFREIEGDELENSKTYNNPGLPLHPDLTPVIVKFIKSLK